MVGAKDAVLVAVESHRLAVADKVAASGLEIVEGRLGHDETQLHEFAGGVVDVDQEGTLGPAVLEPVVFAAVDLDQLAEAFPTIPRLVRSGSALCAGLPNASLSHPPARRFPADPDVVQLDKLLIGQLGSKVSVSLPEQRNDLVSQRLGQSTIAGPPAFLGNQRRGAAG